MVRTKEVAIARAPLEVIMAEEFNKLEGITMQERQKYFGIYLHGIKSSVTSPEDKKSFCNLLKPTNRLEEVQYTRILLELQESEGLLNILTGNNVPLRKMVLKSKLFLDVLKNNFERVASEEFSKEICFLVRLRILIRLGQVFQDDARLDDYYKVVRKQFGLHLAKHLLPACNLTTISEEMAKNKVVFNNKQLTKLHQRFPNFLEDYFNHLKENNYKNFDKYHKLIRYIAKTDVELYFRLLKKHELKTKLSISSTIKFVEKYKEEVLQNGDKYLEVIHNNAAFKHLTLDEFPLVYAKCFPKSFNDVTADLFITQQDVMKRLRQRAPRKLQFAILNDVFKKIYKCDLLEHEDLFNVDLLAIVPVNLREPIIVKKMAREEEGKDVWLTFYDLDKALRIIKEKISKTTDPNKRRCLVNYLVKACLVNDDIPRLAEVFDYIATRHRNEDSAVFNVIFSDLHDFGFEKFSGDHWEGLNKMCKIHYLNKQENVYYSDYTMDKVIEGFWAYKIKNNLSIAEDVSNYIQKYYREYSLNIFSDKKYKKERRIVFDILAEVLPNLFKAKNAEFQRVGNLFMQSIFDSNAFIFKKDRVNISDYPFLINYIRDVMDAPSDDDNQRSNIFGMIKNLRQIKETDVYKKVCDELWKSKSPYIENYWLFFLKHNPEYIIQNYEHFFNHTWFNTYVYEFIENIQYYSHLGIPQLFCEKSKEILTGPDFTGHNMKFNAAVRFLVNSDEFLPVAEGFLPIKDLADEDANIVQIKKTISEVLGNYKNHEDVLNALLALSKSDYLKYCLKTIYKIVYNLPEAKLAKFIEEIASGKVSLNKHVIFITARICGQDRVLSTLKSTGLGQKNTSIQKYLIKTTLTYLNENPSEDCFELVKNHCKLLTEYDAEGFDLMLNFNKIPIQYLSKYVEFIWDFTQGSTIDEVREVKYKILQKLDKDLMQILKSEFLDTLVTKCLNFDKKDADKLFDFIYRYIIIGDLENASKRVDLVVSQFPKSVSVKAVELSKNLLSFTFGFCENVFRETNLDAAKIFGKFKQAWDRNYSFENSFEQAVTLEIAGFFLETENYDLHQKTSLLLNNLLQKYSSYIIPNFATTFGKLFFAFMKIKELQDDEELLKFLLEFLQRGTNLTQLDKEYFVLLALPKTFPKANNAKEKHLKILETLEKSESISIRMNLTCYINSLEEKKDETPDNYGMTCRMRC